MSEVPKFNREAFLKVLKVAQTGGSAFPEFLKDSWRAGVIKYEADLISRKVTYYGAADEAYEENNPAVELKR